MNANQHKHQHPIEKLADEVKRKQSNVTYPDVLLNARNVDALLWKGSRHITRIQRAGVLLLSLAFLLVGILFVGNVTFGSPWLRLPFGLAAIGISCKLFWNSIRKNDPSKHLAGGNQ
ncbi:hypothetical protein [Tunturiibacter lichenicola]|uniref:hypothetical protein n=1 Tax=Tunturiibacter lichenicola TaxID=2051959 RepID=UPI003D9BFD56